MFGVNYFPYRYKEQRAVACLLLDVGDRHHLLHDYFLRSLPVDDSVFPREHDSRNHRAVEILRRTNRIVEHAGLRHRDVMCQPHRWRPRNTATSKLAYSLYFLGLFNLMFGWAHHTYLVPSQTWIRTFAYIVSMTELLLILGKILWDWRGSLQTFQKAQILQCLPLHVCCRHLGFR